MYKRCIVYATMVVVWFLPTPTTAITHTQQELGMLQEKFTETKLACLNTDYCNQELVDYARNKTNHDVRFIQIITVESRRRRQSENPGEGSYGLCQWNDPNLYDGKGWGDWILSREFQNPNRQIDKCYDSYLIRDNEGKLEQQLKGIKYIERTEQYFAIETWYAGELIERVPL